MKQKPLAQSFDVEIAGFMLKLKSTHDESTVHELARYVDEKIKESMPQTKSGSIQTATLLACLNIAEEMILLKRKAQQEVERVESKANRILSHLENSQAPRLGLDH